MRHSSILDRVPEHFNTGFKERKSWTRCPLDGQGGADVQPQGGGASAAGGALCLLRMGGMRPKARQSFSLGWVLVRSKKAPSQVLHEIAVFPLTINGRAQTGNGEGAIFQGVLLMLQNGANSGNRFARAVGNCVSLGMGGGGCRRGILSPWDGEGTRCR